MVSQMSRDFDAAAFQVDGRRLCLDFVATLSGRRAGRAVEHLSEPDDLSRWLIASGVLAKAPAVTVYQLRRARELRETIRDLADAAIAGAPMADEALELANRLARGPRLAPRLDANGLSWAAPAGGDLVDASICSIAADAVELLGGPDLRLLKECASPTCGLLFLDRSQARRRRWCSMEACGNRAKTRHYRRRVKERRGD
jgi:predicted RNA-binding Zn ribbon-like protein